MEELKKKSRFNRFNLNTKILNRFISEYDILIGFLKERDQEIKEFLIERRDSLIEERKEEFRLYSRDVSPKRKITQKEYDNLVELANSLITKEKRFDRDIFLEIQTDLNEKRIDFVFAELYYTMSQTHEKNVDKKDSCLLN